jgi:serine protease
MKDQGSPRRVRSAPAILAMLCLVGIAAGCGGGGGGSTPVYTVTASASEGGTISPQSVAVSRGNRAMFTVSPSQGYLIQSVTGCGGALAGTTYTTAPVTGACQVQATFRRPFVSGTVIPAGGTAVDSDVNDPFAPYAPNDDYPEAQFIPNPVTLGGYANAPGAGPDGRSFTEGDEFDVFRVGLFAGQVVTLLIASENVNDDLDLYLVDLELQIVEASVGDTARVESIVVPPDASGEHFLVVHAFDGASNYLLNIGQAAPAMAPATRLSDAFVPGELIVRLAEDPAVKDGEPAGLGLSGAAGARTQGTAPRNRLVKLDELGAHDARIAAARQGIETLRPASGPLAMLRARDEVMAGKLETLLTAKALARDPAIAAAAPNYLYELHSAFTPNDPHYRLQWHYPQISLPQAWPLNTGSGVIVAVIDSGVYLAHPDLAGRLVPGRDFILGTAGGNDPGDSPIPPGGSSYHGTHVAGTIAAATNNSVGVAGVAFGARVMPLRVCTTTGCPGFAIEQALRYAAGLPNDSGTVPAQTADVVNLSLGRQGGPAVAGEQALFDQLRALDIVVVASAGNSNTSEPSWPAAYQNVLAVSAVDIDARKAYYSNFGPWVDVAAPGGDMRRDVNADGFPDGVLSTSVDDRDGTRLPRYRFLQGTSMAAPHVAGVIALMRSAVPALGAQDIEALLRNDVITDDLGTPGRDDLYGHGLINAAKAVAEALNTGGAPVPLAPLMVASPPSLNFGATLGSATVVLSNSGGGELEFGAPVEDSGGWLGLSAGQSDGVLTLSLSVQRAGLAEGVYAATVRVSSNANTVEVPVFMQVADVLSASIGQQYVLLLDPESFETLHGVIADSAPDGRQPFRIDGVTPGSYLLVSGSDSDNDDFICDDGESCGIYRGPGDVVVIEIDGGDVVGLEFTAGYGLSSAESQSAPLPGRGRAYKRADGADESRLPGYGR